ncbi:uncharacterized protein [Eurosta solidaginis]|uniref:uncharacterized protein n=1 Tax=Eurosta solidaginis TaxID=178769 RepID=UPI003531487D
MVVTVVHCKQCCSVFIIFTEADTLAQMDTSDLYIDYLCRTCMIKLEAFTSEGSTEPQHQSIFETIEECDELRIADLLSSTIPQIVEVQLSDELPKKICYQCLHQLISVYRFQKLCVQSDHKIREMVSKKWDDLNMSMMEAATEDEVLPNDTNSYPLSSCQPKCTAQNSRISETETTLEGRQQAMETESAQWSTAEHLLKNEQLLDYRENSQGGLSEFIKNEPIDDGEENTKYSDTIHSTTFVNEEEFTTEEQKVTVPYKNIRYKNKQYPCDVCGKHFKATSALNTHKLIHSSEKPHKCDFCEKRFAQAAHLRQHMRTHTGEKPYKCKYCEQSFAQIGVLNKHLRVIHLGDNIHRCTFCPLAFRLASELRLHSTMHKDEDPETRERNMAALREEEAKLKVNRLKTIHDRIKLYPCKICSKQFRTKGDLNAHKQVHSDEFPYKCDFCGKQFKKTMSLSFHMRIHSGKRPYKCKYCTKSFTQLCGLNKHLRKHLGENIYRCELCPLAFPIATELRLHFTTHINEDPETRQRNMEALKEEEAKLKQQASNKFRTEKRRWTTEETRAFLSAYIARKDEFLHAPNKKFGMQNVLLDLESQGVLSQPTTVEMLLSKFKNLRAYKQSSDNNRRTGATPCYAPYSDLLDEIFGDIPVISNKHSINLYGKSLSPNETSSSDSSSSQPTPSTSQTRPIISETTPSTTSVDSSSLQQTNC